MPTSPVDRLLSGYGGKKVELRAAANSSGLTELSTTLPEPEESDDVGDDVGYMWAWPRVETFLINVVY